MHLRQISLHLIGNCNIIVASDVMVWWSDCDNTDHDIRAKWLGWKEQDHTICGSDGNAIKRLDHGGSLWAGSLSY